MRNYTQAEVCLLLLSADCSPEPAMTPRQFARVEEALLARGRADGGEVTRAELLRLGLGPEEAESALVRLEGMDALRAHLRAVHSMGVRIITRISPEYPKRLLAAMGRQAPLLLYCAGALSLLDTPCVSLVGSRKLREPGRDFARAVGRAAASSGKTYVSGGAVGADTEGFSGAWRAGGRAILFLPDSLRERIGRMGASLQSGRLLLVSLDGPDQSFSVRRAFARNSLIHAMGEKVFVAQTDQGRGGTWQGVTENLEQHWSPVYMCSQEPEDPGTAALIRQGAAPLRTADIPDMI